jgi:hypothetical protein
MLPRPLHCAGRPGHCAGVQNGRATGVTVRTDPPAPALADCVANAVRTLTFPAHPGLDITRTTFK